MIDRTLTNVDLEQLWSRVIAAVTSDAQNNNLEMLLSGSRPIYTDDGDLVIEFPTRFARDWVETRYYTQLHGWTQEIFGTPLNLRLLVRGEEPQRVTTPTPRVEPYRTEPIRISPHLDPTIRSSHPPHAEPRSSVVEPVAPSAHINTMHTNGSDRHDMPTRAVMSETLNPKYTFDTFVVGSGNRFPHAAALAAASEPAAVYNPLFLYGGVGLGKTHLMQAIGHYVLKHHPHLHVVYVSSERFTNDLINALQTKSMVEFRQRYRSVDVLLIDDIHFVAGKESTQEEFFHTFNALYQANKQIVISSDRPPKEIPTLEDRLRSRFEWGLTADVQAPDIETRVAILRQKARNEGYSVPDEVLDFIASHIQSNIRELEGALIRVIAFSSLHHRPLSVELAAEALKEILPDTQPKPITMPRIQEIVASHFGIKVADLKGKRRSRAVTLPRQIAMYLCRELTDASLPRIGEEFGGRDHTTVMHACEKIRKDSESDAAFMGTIQALIDRIRSGN